MNKVVLTGVLVLLSAQASLAEPFRVDPTVGNSTMGAVFDAPLGERINAVSSSIDCALDVDTVKGTASGKCSIPLISIIVDNQPTKTSHFQQWATNKKVEPEKCTFDLSFKDIKVMDPVKPQT
ncbi:MAG: hypothetical protein AB1405_14830, partial [Bdellovibrionota bacterium]